MIKPSRGLDGAIAMAGSLSVGDNNALGRQVARRSHVGSGYCHGPRRSVDSECRTVCSTAHNRYLRRGKVERKKTKAASNFQAPSVTMRASARSGHGHGHGTCLPLRQEEGTFVSNAASSLAQWQPIGRLGTGNLFFSSSTSCGRPKPGPKQPFGFRGDDDDLIETHRISTLERRGCRSMTVAKSVLGGRKRL